MMKNLNESHNRREDDMEEVDTSQQPAVRSEAEVVPFQRRDSAHEPLLPKRQLEELRERWASIQTNFVDQPRKAVEDADALVAQAIKQIEEVFVAQRANLEKKWHRGDDVSTEDFRVSLQHYRAFFDHLLSLTDAHPEGVR